MNGNKWEVMNKIQIVLGWQVSYNCGLIALKRWTMYIDVDNLYGYSIHKSNLNIF